MSARITPDAPPDTVLTATEITALDRIDAARARPRLQCRALAGYQMQIAPRGSYLGRTHDPPPSIMVVAIECRLRRFRKRLWGSVRVDETYIRVQGQWRYLYRVIDNSG